MPEPGGALLVLDYPGRRDEARVQDLGLELDGWQTRYLIAPPLSRELRCADYALHLIDRFGLRRLEVRAILAYCTGAPIAQEMAAALGSPAEPMPLLLFDGAPALPAKIANDFRLAAQQLGGGSRPQDPPVDPEAFTAAALQARPVECFERMKRHLGEIAAQALRADGAGDEEAAAAAADIAAVYLDWLAYLVAGHNTSWPGWNGEVLHLASQRHRFTDAWPGSARTRLCRIEASAGDLLRHPQTRVLTLSFLNDAQHQSRGTACVSAREEVVS